MSDPPDLGVFVTRPPWERREPLLNIRHHDDGDWTFWGATEPTDDNAFELLLLVHLGHVVERYPEVQDLATLPHDKSAVRSFAGEIFTEGD